VKPYAFAEAVLDHYGVSGDHADDLFPRIETAVQNSAVETGGWGTGSLCAYHYEQAAKDE
jgi:hypothetical protein